MQRHILPIATEVHRDLDLFQQRHEVALVPPGVSERVFDNNGAPQVVPRVRIVVQLEQDLSPVIAASPLKVANFL